MQEVDKERGRIGLKLVAKHENGALVQPEELIERAKDAPPRPRGGAPARRPRSRPRRPRRRPPLAARHRRRIEAPGLTPGRFSFRGDACFGGLVYPSASRGRPLPDLTARLAPRCASVLEMAQEEQRSSKQEEVTAEHLLLGILREKGKAAEVLEQNGVTEEQARSFVAEALWDEEPDYSQLRLSNEVTQIMEATFTEADKLGQAKIEPELLLYGITLAGFDTTSRLLYAPGGGSCDAEVRDRRRRRRKRVARDVGAALRTQVASATTSCTSTSPPRPMPTPRTGARAAMAATPSRRTATGDSASRDPLVGVSGLDVGRVRPGSSLGHSEGSCALARTRRSGVTRPPRTYASAPGISVGPT